ncbi:MAG: ABC transporter permease [Firmicutes bacterium]|nr:ABC transporter permease [[Eubacterium] siraeum]MCM1487450.1 ABC transporter permease [Bacillota bacterium]
MKYIFKNIFYFAKHETIIFVIVAICIISSAFVMNFSYGLYFNYNTAINEATEELKTLWPLVNENENLTKGEFQQLVEALDSEMQDKINLIYASSDLTKIGYDEHYSFFPMRFDINNNRYCVPSVVRDSWYSSKMITSGEYISDEDEEAGAFSAIVSQENCDKSEGETIEFLGHTYTIVGKYKGASVTPLVPFLTVPDDLVIVDCSFSFDNVLTRQTYETFKNTVKEIIPNKLILPDLRLPDDDTFSLYSNIIMMSVFIAILSVMNFAMLYLFIIRKRKNMLAVMRLCGVTRRQASAIYLGECLLITVPEFMIGTLMFDFLLNTVFSDMFMYMRQAFDLLAYILIPAIYLIVMAVILGIIIFRNTDINIKDCLTEGKI